MILGEHGGMSETIHSAAPRLVGHREVAAMAGVSERTWRRLVAAERTPAPIRLGKRVLWRIEEIDAWLRAGCPQREEWEVTPR